MVNKTQDLVTRTPLKPELNSGHSEWCVVPAPLVESLMLHLYCLLLVFSSPVPVSVFCKLILTITWNVIYY